MKFVKIASLPSYIREIVCHKGTERPFTGEYENTEEAGSYLCRQCGLALFRSTSKFYAGCGWPSFDEEIVDAVRYQPDSDGRREEILCARCDAHLGHVFVGEKFTLKDKRYCVNSLSLDYVPNLTVTDTKEAVLAAGCFWGVEYYFKRLPGVLKTEVGYTGGQLANPSYQSVCQEKTGHYEAIRVVYDPMVVSYEQLIKYFFEIHDPTQTNGQGPDIGEQYLSAIFYYDHEQQACADNLISQLMSKGYKIITKVLPVDIFWQAENYHQQYYSKNNSQPYCHRYIKKF